ncbi:MAG: ATP-dependent sacrificial sulfur transferase LarE [Kiritimatiellae bacterium]|nr:ATP-dependent sacrificial sulfur transferase LarE [Kiritimatiellia bacterium]
MNDELAAKCEALKSLIRDTGGLAVAFSGGVDSTFLAAVTAEVLGARALAVTALSPLYSQHEQKEASELAEQIGIKHETVDSSELDVPGFAENPPDRCYKCKSELFTVVAEIARKYGIEKVADGTNASDRGDYRPGRKAAREKGVLSPLAEAGMTKEDIRELSRGMNLSTAEKPAFACLASRFPYGTTITVEKLKSVEIMEDALRKNGINQFRVRHHDDIARIEVVEDDLVKLCTEPMRSKLLERAQEAGYLYLTVDLKGYRTGSMNEALSVKQKTAALG